MALDLGIDELLDDILSKVPEADRAAVRANYSRAKDKVRGFETQLEQSVRESREVAEKQTTWWNQNKDAVVERNQLRAEKGQPTPTPTPAAGLTPEALQEILDRRDNQVLNTGLNLITDHTKVALGHLKEFGEEVDMGALVQGALKANKPLVTYYTEQIAPRRQERETAARAAEIEAVRKEERTKVVAEMMLNSGKGLPFPVAGQPTTLDGLRKPEAGAADPYSLDAAVATATQELQRRAS